MIKEIHVAGHCFSSIEELKSIQRLATINGLKTLNEFEKFIKNHFNKK